MRRASEEGREVLGRVSADKRAAGCAGRKAARPSISTLRAPAGLLLVAPVVFAVVLLVLLVVAVAAAEDVARGLLQLLVVLAVLNLEVAVVAVVVVLLVLL